MSTEPAILAQGPKFSIGLEETTDPPRLQLHGSLSPASPDELMGVFERVHERLLARGVSAAEIDLQGLEFMNSTAFKPFIHWLSLIEKAPAEQRYRLRFKLSQQRRWQAISFSALASLSPNLVSKA